MTKINIELERPTGVYYAGEVVRGTVAVCCPQDTTCRGFILQLSAAARIHWHTGSGDDRKDYYGHTIFQDQRVTAIGKYYKTSLLDNAGENAMFDDIHNLGILQIPTTSRERNNLKLIVRVMDYDWGKKDDLLGEILLDVPQLLTNSGQPQSFPLTRKGRPEKGEVTLSAKWLPYDALFPTTSRSGVAVSLSLQTDCCLVLRIHQATGLRKADWIGKNDVYVQVYRPQDAKDEMVVGQTLPGPNKKMVLRANEEFVAPFAFLLRKDAPGSAELGMGDYSYIRYTLGAHIDLATWKDPSSKRVISVIPNRPIPKVELLSPYHQSAGPEPMYEYSCCCQCCSTGVVSIDLKLDRLAYAAGEIIDISNSKIVNDTEKPLNVEVILMTTGVLKCPMRSTTRHKEHSLAKLPPVAPNQTLHITRDALSLKIPPLYPSFWGGVDNPTRIHYACLKWSYSLSIRATTDATCSGFVQATMPVLISSSPPYEHILKEYREMPPKECAMTLWDPLDMYAYKDADESAPTAPNITGAEDGGHAVETGAVVSTYNYQEHNVDSTTDEYKPIVNAFDGPTTTSSTAAATTATSTASSGGFGGGSHALVQQLLDNMENEFDKRLAVGTWIRDHGHAALDLQPPDFNSILSKVTFSLDQSSVVGELVSAFEGSGKLTCAHIIATMEACSYQKTEVALLMAPHVNDPINKESVLEKLDYSFDKTSVSNAFGGEFT